ncbi:hypothetical protein KW795_01585 [Candidatus Microgenomates bacterium]|nr:hypothetical protein [Candidatus Microgenomates bacterium]
MAAKTGTGLSKNTSGALAYVLGPVTGIVFLVIEKDSFVRFHAMQSIVVFGLLMILGWVLPITIVLAVLLPILWIVELILWLVLIYKAWQGDEWEVPVLGKIARQLLAKA